MTSFTVNGKAVSVEDDADTPLLWVLRDTLRHTEVRFGCGVASCGACTVYVNGQATRACVLPVSAVAGAEVTTVGGLQGKEAEAVMSAWEELQVPQCGWCQSGQVMSAVQLLKNTPQVDDAAIDNAMSGNVCRCATYVRIRAAIHRAAAILKEQG